MLITADTVVTGRELLRPGWIDVDRGRVRAIGAGAPPRPADLELGAVTVVPGFVDMHVHGGGGGAFPTADPSEIDGATATAVELHRRHGTTTMIASLVAAHPAELLAQVRGDGRTGADPVSSPASIWRDPGWRRNAVAPMSCRRCGTRIRPSSTGSSRPAAARSGWSPWPRNGPAGWQRDPADRGCRRGGRCRAHRGHLRPGAGGRRRGGDRRHPPVQCDAAGAPPRARPVLALMEDPRVTVELITDGVHLHPALYRDVSRSVGPDRVALVTDAMAAAGMADGAYRLGPLAVDVVDGVARVAGTDTIAGSTATMDQVFRYAVDEQRTAPRRRAAGRGPAVVGQPGPGAGPAGGGAGRRRGSGPGGARRRTGRDRSAPARLLDHVTPDLRRGWTQRRGSRPTFRYLHCSPRPALLVQLPTSVPGSC